MSVSRLDVAPLLTNFAAASTTGSGAGESPVTGYPVNTLVAVHVYGTFGGGSVSLEVTPDGTNWVPAVSAPASLTAAGCLVWQGAALGIRCKVTGATTPSINAKAVFSDQG